MDRDLRTLTALLLDPFLTTGEAAQEADALAVTVRHPGGDHFPPSRSKNSRTASRSSRPSGCPATDAGADCAAC